MKEPPNWRFFFLNYIPNTHAAFIIDCKLNSIKKQDSRIIKMVLMVQGVYFHFLIFSHFFSLFLIFSHFFSPFHFPFSLFRIFSHFFSLFLIFLIFSHFFSFFLIFSHPFIFHSHFFSFFLEFVEGQDM